MSAHQISAFREIFYSCARAQQIYGHRNKLDKFVIPTYFLAALLRPFFSEFGSPVGGQMENMVNKAPISRIYYLYCKAE